MPSNTCNSHGAAQPHEHKGRYCGSKNRHPPHTGPMIGNEALWFDCRGRE